MCVVRFKGGLGPWWHHQILERLPLEGEQARVWRIHLRWILLGIHVERNKSYHREGIEKFEEHISGWTHEPHALGFLVNIWYQATYVVLPLACSWRSSYLLGSPYGPTRIVRNPSLGEISPTSRRNGKKWGKHISGWTHELNALRFWVKMWC